MKFLGTVIHGDGHGRTLGFPTVNIDQDDYHKQGFSLNHGVYAGIVTIPSINKHFVSSIVIGSPDVDKALKIEAHLIGFSGDLYGQVVEFCIKEFVCPLKKYYDEESLKRGISENIECIKKMNVCLPE